MCPGRDTINPAHVKIRPLMAREIELGGEAARGTMPQLTVLI